MVLGSIPSTDGEQSKKTRPTTVTSSSWNPEYDATNTNNCSNSHMSLSHQSVLVDEKSKQKKKKKRKG